MDAEINSKKRKLDEGDVKENGNIYQVGLFAFRLRLSSFCKRIDVEMLLLGHQNNLSNNVNDNQTLKFVVI